MKKVQMNLQVPIEVKEYIYAMAEADDRKPAYILTKIIESLINKAKPKPKTKGIATKGQWAAPEGLNLNAWDEFEAFRKSIKKPLTDVARTKAANIISGLSELDQQATIDRSIQAGWAGLFPEKTKQQDNRPFFEKNNESVREQLFGKKGETYEH